LGASQLKCLTFDKCCLQGELTFGNLFQESGFEGNVMGDEEGKGGGLEKGKEAEAGVRTVQPQTMTPVPKACITTPRP